MSSKRTKKKNTAMTARLAEQLDGGVSQESGAEKGISADDLIQTVRSMDSALNENYEEVAEAQESEEALSGAAEAGTEAESAAAPRPNRFYLVFAVFIIIMSLIGIVSTVRFIAGQIESIADQAPLKNEIALFIYPVVTVDPPEFQTAAEIPANVVIESAIWRIILTGDNTNYEKQYNTYMYVPAVDVEFAAHALFGSEAVITHQTVGNVGSAFTYEEEKNSYLVPISPRYTAYSPQITSVTNVGELYTVCVDYMPPAALAVKGINLQNTSTKTMEYTLSRSKNSMTIHSIRNTTQIGDTYAY